MALRNFVINDSYSRIELITYSKQKRQLSARFVVYEDATLQRVIIDSVHNINGAKEAIFVDNVLNDRAYVVEQTPEWRDLVPGENNLILLTDEEVAGNEFLVGINRSIVRKTVNGGIIYERPEYMTNGTVLQKRLPDGTLGPCPFIETKQQFEETFPTDKVIPALYIYMKSLPEFVGCVDV